MDLFDRWFFASLSESQAETKLNSGRVTPRRDSRFLISDLPPSKNYRLSIRSDQFPKLYRYTL